MHTEKEITRIASLLPSATELVCALGLQDRLVGVTHECDYPPEVACLPRLTERLLPQSDPKSLDSLVTQAVHTHRSLYHLDIDALERLDVDLILTQELCDVCAVAYDEVVAAARLLHAPTTVVSLEPQTLEQVFEQLDLIGRLCGVEDWAKALHAKLRQRVAAYAEQSSALAHPSVYVMEWLDPPWAAGHWVPEMVAAAGGQEVLGKAGLPSRRIDWEELFAANPQYIVFAPCGYDLAGIVEEVQRVAFPKRWSMLRAVREEHLYAVQASAYFSRPGSRVVDGIATLAEILHPEVFGTDRQGQDWVPVTFRCA
ncbi:MAG: cobalamin-binding protein [Firmicutes bacterium]|nr:cobalamin-binding protein [Bacillota bacterium]